MASTCQRFVKRTTLSSIKSAVRSSTRSAPLNHKPSISSSSSSRLSAPTTSTSTPLRRFSISRSPSELGCVQSLLPLHSAVAAARMNSSLSTTSRRCRALSEGT